MIRGSPNEAIRGWRLCGCVLRAPRYEPDSVGGLGPTCASYAIRLRQEGPSEACKPNCRTWVSATGAITSDTPRDFEAFAKTRNVRGSTLVLDSDGGSVLGALALGRTVRKLGMMTAVGKTIELPLANGERRAQIAPNAYCELMCAFVLLAGIERHVPAEARVLVHQIWLGDRRDDPTAAHYSAEDLVLVQRDIGRLAQYTVEMGGAIDLLETALKIPPWEPMRLLSREELRGMKIITGSNTPEVNSGAAVAALPMSNGTRATIQERSWVTLENARPHADHPQAPAHRGRRGDRQLRSDLLLRRSRQGSRRHLFGAAPRRP